MSITVKEVKVIEQEPMNLAYLSYTGPYAGDTELFGRLFGQLCAWAGPKGLLNFPDTKMLTVYHDNPDVTPPEKSRISVAMTVSPDTEVDGEIGKMTLDGGTYAVGSYELTPNKYEDAWMHIYATWLPTSGYAPLDKPNFEVYLNEPDEDPTKLHIVDIYVPVQKMN